MSISTGGIDFSKLYETQATGNNGAAAQNNVPTGGATQEPRGSEMDKFLKDMKNFKNLNLQ